MLFSLQPDILVGDLEEDGSKQVILSSYTMSFGLGVSKRLFERCFLLYLEYSVKGDAVSEKHVCPWIYLYLGDFSLCFSQICAEHHTTKSIHLKWLMLSQYVYIHTYSNTWVHNSFILSITTKCIVWKVECETLDIPDLNRCHLGYVGKGRDHWHCEAVAVNTTIYIM